MAGDWLDENEGKDRTVLTLVEVPKVPILIDADAVKTLRNFLIVDRAGTGISYSDFIRKAVEMWRGMLYPNLTTLADDPHDCPTCGNSGFSGYGTGYDAVCGDCGGQSAMVIP